MPKIFISHATEDNELSRKLAQQLRLDGAEIWIYYAEFEVEDILPKAFKEAIEWCDTFILLWSKASADSELVRMEYRRALVLKKKIILCLLDETEQTHGLRYAINIDFKDFEKGYGELRQVLNLEVPVDETINENDELAQEQGSVSLRSEVAIDNTIDENTANNEAVTKFDLQVIQFRCEPGKLSEDEVTAMIKKYNFFDIKRNGDGDGIARNLEIQEVNGDKVILDPISDLMWQHGGTSNSIWYDHAKYWIAELNQHGYAGHHDWRLPTLEEAMSLMKKDRDENGLYIDPIFDPRQICIWTSDVNNNASRAWVVFFNYGSCYINCFDFNNFVRAVRSMEPPSN